MRGCEVRWCRWSAQAQGPVGPGSPEGRPPVTTSTRGVGSSCATWVEARGRDREDRWPSIGACITTPTDRSTKIATTLVNRNGLEDHLGAAVAQVALLGQLPPQIQDQVLDVGRCALRRAGDGRSVLPIHPVQSQAPCTLDPVAHRRLADTEAMSDLVLGPTATDGLDDLATALNRQALLLMATSRRSVVSVKATPWRAIGRSFKARRRTDVNDRQVVAAT